MWFGWMGITNGNEKNNIVDSRNCCAEKQTSFIIREVNCLLKDERKMPNSLGLKIFIYCPSISTLGSAWSLLQPTFIRSHSF